jgi:hypothetical protein
MSGVCDLNAVTVKIYPEEILPLTLGSFEMMLFAAANICYSYLALKIYDWILLGIRRDKEGESS